MNARRWCIAWLLCGLALVPTLALARQAGEPRSWSLVEKTVGDGIPRLRLPAIDRAALLAEDAAGQRQLKGGGVLRFAQPLPLAVTTRSHGRWLDLPDGARLWQLRIQVPQASDLNFTVAFAKLPQAATLHVFSTRERYYQGPYLAADLQRGGRFWSPLVPGDEAVLELYLPAAARSADLLLGAVNAGYRDMFGREGLPLLKQGSCNIDVVCPLGNGYRDEIRSVTRYSINGTGLCTGTLVMDAVASFRPWILTAAHCGITSESIADSLVFYWNYQSSSCGALSGGSLSDNQAGAGFRALRTDVDMSLVELDAPPDPAFNVFYSGWDRSGIAPAGSIHIHHPRGDEKAISFNDDPLTTGDSCIASGGVDSHWIIDNYEQGTTEPGSSGSGVWTTAPNPRLIGFLSGGGASCSNLAAGDCYGKLAVAWDGSASNRRLRDWLGAGLSSPPTSTDGANPGGFSVTLSVDTLQLCPNRPEQLEVLVDSGDGFAGPVALTLQDAPSGLLSSFIGNPLTPPGSAQLELTASANLPPGNYPVSVQGSAGSSSQSAGLSLQVLGGAPASAPALQFPATAALVDRFPNLDWAAVDGANDYRVEVSSRADFATRLIDATTTASNYPLNVAMPADSLLYWRVTARNACGNGVSASSRFTTTSALCAEVPVAIADASAAGVSRTLTVTDAGDLTDLDVALAITHTYVGDLRAVLTHAGRSATLLDQPGKPASSAGCSGADIDAILDDAASAAAENQCAAGSPTISGRYQPSTPLATFAGESLSGDWVLTVADLTSADSGSLNRWCLLPTLSAGSTIFHDGFED